MSRRIGSILRLAAALACLALAATPALARAHAVLERTEPARGAALDAAPSEIVLRFSEPVEVSFGAIRIYDAEGSRVEAGEISRPDGEDDGVSVALPGDLPDGTYTATFRVVSADSHPVSGGFVFSVGDPGAGPAESVSELLENTDVGAATEVAYWAARWLGYAAVGLGAGLLFFCVAVWLPALARVRPGPEARTAARSAFIRRARALLVLAALVGAASGLAALVLQAATASGVSFWSALDPDRLSEVLETRFGRVTALRVGAWITVLSLVAPARFGAAFERGGRAVWAMLALAAGTAVVTPAFEGHAATQDPSLLLVPADVLHIASMAVWLGGLVALGFAVGAATRALGKADKSALLAATLARFSPIALAAVLALAAAGVIQAIAYVGPLSDLVETAFGRAVLIKAGILIVLVGLGWLNRARVIPGLREVATRREAPGRAGRLIRQTIRAEIALVVVVLGVSAALVSYPPPSEARGGPISGSVELGPARLDYTVDPASVGANEMHLYLFDSVTGEQFTGGRDVHVHLALPEREIGPIEAELAKAGPGHFVAPATPFGVAGDWRAEIGMRLSRFEQVEATFDVPID